MAVSELGAKVKASIERLKAFCPQEGYYLAFSGGKDSVVCKALMDMSGCKYDATYRITSVDPPELVRFIKEKHPDVKREFPRYSDGSVITMWNLIPRKLMPPTRLVRYCCSYLKESGGDGRMTVTGVRWAESDSREKNHGVVTIASAKAKKELNEEDYKKAPKGGLILTNDNQKIRRVVESCYKRHKTMINPIVDWEDENVWEFIKAERIPYCELYDDGFPRLGCIGCAMAGQHAREREFLRYPAYKRAYLRAFDRMLTNRKQRGLMDSSWRSGFTSKDIFNWWMEYDVFPVQMDLLEDYEE